MKARTLKEYIAEQKKRPDFKKAWDELDPEFELLESMLTAREKAGLTQDELARKIGTKQPALSRLERGGLKTATVETLSRIATALDSKLVVRFEPIKGKLAYKKGKAGASER